MRINIDINTLLMGSGYIPSLFLAQDTTKSISSSGTAINKTTSAAATTATTAFKFYILNVPNLTSTLLARHGGKNGAAEVYGDFFNEDKAEMWLHRGLASFTYEQGQTMDPNEADVFFIPGYLHYWLNRTLMSLSDKNELEGREKREAFADQVLSVIVNQSKPHVLLIPTRDPNMNKIIGLRGLVEGLQKEGVNLYSVGFERNSFWQTVTTDRIIPIPYVVEPPTIQPELFGSAAFNDNKINSNGHNNNFQQSRIENFVFLSAHPRPNAMAWSGCNRSMISPLVGRKHDNMDIQLNGNKHGRRASKNRISQELYNERMQTSDYCLILCGDTPTSRSLASAMMAGCIPLRVGSWWRGLCEPPCQLNRGFSIANQSHFSFAHDINWGLFPELNETKFAQDPVQTLRDFFNQTTLRQDKRRTRAEMQRVQQAWIYGWGNPVTSRQFGELYSYLWKSTLHEVGLLP
jgi:hypothetical protein